MKRNNMETAIKLAIEETKKIVTKCSHHPFTWCTECEKRLYSAFEALINEKK